MPRDAEPSLNEKAFVLRALQEGHRLDGRALDAYRALHLSFGDQSGVVDVQLGKTRLLAKASAEVTRPYADRPFEGIFTITAELSPMASPAFLESSSASNETETLLSRLLEKTVRRSNAMDTESLCLVAGQKVWSVRTDVHVLSLDGGLVDTACFAVVAALRHFRIPDSSIDGDTLTVYTAAEREPVPLSWLHSPLCVTFSFYYADDEGVGETVLVDATALEEQLRASSCTVSMNKHGEICQVSKLGGGAVDALTLLKCARMAVVRVREFSDMLDARLEEDAKRRDKGGLMAELSAENPR